MSTKASRLEFVIPAAIRRLIGPFRRRIAALALTSFLGGALEALFLVLVTQIAIAVSERRTEAITLLSRSVSLHVALSCALAVLICRFVFGSIGVRIASAMTHDCSVQTRKALTRAYFSAPWALQQSERAGRLQQMLSEFVTRTLEALNAITTLTSAALTLGALLIVSVAVSSLATLLVLVVLVALGSVLAPMRRRVKDRSRDLLQANMQFASGVAELGGLGLEMQAFGRQEAFEKAVLELTSREARSRLRLDRIRQMVPLAYNSLAYAALLAALTIGVAAGSADLASIGAVVVIMLRSLAYGQQLQIASTTIRSSAPTIESIEDSVAKYRGGSRPQGQTALGLVQHIAMEDVSFGYTEHDLVLRNLSFGIEAGEFIGIVGPSGGGKSTLVHLLLGLREPTAGVVTVNGIDIRHLDRNAWTGQVAYVPQDVQLYSGTISENVRFFRTGIDDRSIIEAMRLAHLTPEVGALPLGLSTAVGERGSQLSGGQRQRLGIARALAGNPRVLILDEPTSALDGRSEQAIRETLSTLKGHLTLIVVAHRMTTVELCDRIMVVERGEIKSFAPPS